MIVVWMISLGENNNGSATLGEFSLTMWYMREGRQGVANVDLSYCCFGHLCLPLRELLCDRGRDHKQGAACRARTTDQVILHGAQQHVYV